MLSKGLKLCLQNQLLDKVDKKILKGLINEEEKGADQIFEQVKNFKIGVDFTKSDISKVDK